MNKCVLFSSYQSQNPYLRIQQYLTFSNVLLVLHVVYRSLSEESQERCTNHNSDFIETFKSQNSLVLNMYKFVSSSPHVGTDSLLISRPMVTVHYPGKNSTYQTNIKVTGKTGLHTVCTHIVDSGQVYFEQENVLYIVFILFWLIYFMLEIFCLKMQRKGR